MAKKPLYVSRRLLNHEPFLAWAKSQGFANATPPEHLHVTIIYSKTPVDWTAIERIPGNVRIAPTTINRSVVALGDKGAVVLKFKSALLKYRWKEFLDIGCSHDWDTFQPHVTITYDAGSVNFKRVQPYNGELVFEPEIFAPINEDFAEELQEIRIMLIRLAHTGARC